MNTTTDIRTSDSIDAKVTQDLLTTLVDSRRGYTDAAEKLQADGRTDIARRLETVAVERERLAADLETLAATYGDTVGSDGSTLATLHRVWMSLKDTLTGSDSDAVLAAAITGEKYAIGQFEQALEQDVSSELKMAIETQLVSIRKALQNLESIVGVDA